MDIRVVKVIWTDPHSIDEWCDISEAADSPITKIISVGIYIKETKDKLVLALNLDTEGIDCSCVMVIPKCAILETQELCFVKKIC